MENVRKWWSFDSFTLKMIGFLTMTVDHVGMVFFPEVLGFRIIGRIAFPVFACLIAEGVIHTHDVAKYARRLLALALISEVPFDLLFFGKPIFFRYQNVFFTLFLGVCMLMLYEKQHTAIMKGGIVIFCFLIADLLACDYGGWGLAMIFCFYVLREKRWQQLLAVGVINVVCFGWIQSFAVLSFLFLGFYNGKEGKKLGKWIYFYYPVHMVVLFLIELLIRYSGS